MLVRDLQVLADPLVGPEPHITLCFAFNSSKAIRSSLVDATMLIRHARSRITGTGHFAEMARGSD
jgi:hypothetical protein